MSHRLHADFHFDLLLSSSSPGAFRSGSDGKSDPSFDLFGFRSTPAKGRSPGFDLSSPRSTGLHPPPVPIFQPSPRRASNISTYVSPESRNRRSSLASSNAGGKAFSFSPQPAFASPPATGTGGGRGGSTSAGATNNVNGGHASFTSVFASILGDAHSRISPTNLSAAAAAARDGSAVRSHFGGMFTAPDAGNGPATDDGAAAGGTSGSGAQPGNTMLVPVEGGLPPNGGSPLQLHQSTPGSAPADSGDDNREDGDDNDDNDGYDAVAARRPSRRRALDFDGAAGAVAGAGDGNGNNNNGNNTNDNGMNKYEISNPLSPSMGPVVIESIEALLPIPRLRDSGDEESGEGGSGDRHRPKGPVLVASSTRGVTGTTAGGVSLLPGLTRGGGGGGGSHGGNGMSFMDSLAQSPISMRPGIIRREDIIDSPAVKEATNAAVAAAMQANAEKRPARAAAAGAAAAAAAAAGGSPMSRRPSAAHHAAGNVDPGLFDASGLLSVTGSAGGVRCNCKKSRCMKLYCDCFKTLGYCGDGCSCVGCSNREDNAPAVDAARESILQRNPQAFTEKISAAVDTGTALGEGLGDGSFGINGNGSIPLQAQHRRGCNCKKSKCLKKYCECFQAGIPCGESCKCCGCHNTTEAMAAGKPPFDRKRIQQQHLQQSAPTLPSMQYQMQNHVQQQQQLEEPKVEVKRNSEEESAGGSGSGTGSDDGGVKPASASAPAKTTNRNAAGAPGMQQFAALGPAFQQILLQQALTRNGGANGAANGGTPPPDGQANGKQGSLTVNNQVLVPISWPIGAAGAGAANNAAAAAAAVGNGGAPNGTTAQQLLTLAASNANAAFSNQFAAAIAAAQKNAANVAAAVAAAAAAKDTPGSNGKATPSVGPSSQDENPSSVEAGGTTSNRRKPPLPPGGAAAIVRGSGSGGDEEKPRLTPTKRKPARTMTAALS